MENYGGVKRGSAVPEGTALLILGSFDTSFFDLVEERLVAHAEQLRCLAPVPVDLAQRIGNHDALGR